MIPVPKQHNTKEEKQKPHRLSQKDTDAPWTKKNSEFLWL
ncbi:Mobile element protein [Richelia intracellularis]|nr:Mobile element protein [Richelia intracellularis]